MLFPTTDFAIFFGIVFLGNWLLRPYKTAWKIFILLASYVFYSWWDWRFVFLLAVSTLCTATGGYLVDKASTESGRRAGLIATLVAELGLLGWFKYYGFFSVSVDNGLHKLGFHGTALPLLSVTLPVGISFFTFMGLSYVFDIYRRKLRRARSSTSPSSSPSSRTSSPGRSCAAPTSFPRWSRPSGGTRVSWSSPRPPT